jgi:hypothetical protein
MKMLFLRCDVCGANVQVEPLHTTQLRNITGHKCMASLTFQNSEFKVWGSIPLITSQYEPQAAPCRRTAW